MQTKGINHLALVCRDMAETQAFYTKVLGMPLVKTITLPDGGQHFFFDCGGGNLLAFFWWENAPAAAPGIASVADFPSKPRSAVGSMNHVAFSVDEDELAPAIERLKAAGGAVLIGPFQVPTGGWIVQGADLQGASFCLLSANK